MSQSGFVSAENLNLSLQKQAAASAGYIERISYGMGGLGVALQVTDTISATNSGLYYMHSDHLGSLSMMTDEAGAVVDDSIVRHLPFGGYRGGDPAAELRTLTDAGYTGHKTNDSIGLVYMNARYYASELRRFVSADTIVPHPDISLSYNRYSYVRGNPVNMNDPSGHNGCSMGYLDCDDDGEVDPPAGVTAEIHEALIVAGEDAGKAALVAVTTPIAVGGLVKAIQAVKAVVSSAATAACADGNCTNEIESVWKFKPLQRGKILDRILGNNLGETFKTYDIFDKSSGTATSIKSIDLGAKTYQNMGRITSTLKSAVKSMLDFKEYTLNNVTLTANDIVNRKLLVAIHSNATSKQLETLAEFSKWASETHKIIVEYVVAH